jgi:hypothetical protein
MRTSAEGTQVVTSTLQTYGQFVHFEMAGFHFSVKTVKLSLNGNDRMVVMTTTTITCQKGRLKKAVSGSKPKCPRGYKKK